MALVRQTEAPIFKLPNAPGVTFTGLVSPKRGSRDVSTWRVRIEGGTPGTPHSVTREEIFVGLSGRARATVEGVVSELGPGDVLVVPAHRLFSLEPLSEEPFEAMVAFPVGGQAKTDSATFTPPWAE